MDKCLEHYYIRAITDIFKQLWYWCTINLYQTFVLPMDKMADQNLPGYQPSNVADTDYVNEQSV